MFLLLSPNVRVRKKYCYNYFFLFFDQLLCFCCFHRMSEYAINIVKAMSDLILPFFPFLKPLKGNLDWCSLLIIRQLLSDLILGVTLVDTDVGSDLCVTSLHLCLIQLLIHGLSLCLGLFFLPNLPPRLSLSWCDFSICFHFSPCLDIMLSNNGIFLCVCLLCSFLSVSPPC